MLQHVMQSTRISHGCSISYYLCLRRHKLVLYEKDHAMDCIVHAGHVAKNINDEIPPPVPGSASEEDFLDERMKQKIRTLTMEGSESDNHR